MRAQHPDRDVNPCLGCSGVEIALWTVGIEDAGSNLLGRKFQQIRFTSIIARPSNKARPMPGERWPPTGRQASWMSSTLIT